MASLKDIAAECGLSIAAVSKALADRPDIGAETKTRVRETAQRLGYVPNLSARALKTSRRYEVGVLLGETGSASGEDGARMRDLLAFRRRAGLRGYGAALLGGSREENGGLSLLAYCRYRGFDGAAVLGGLPETSDTEELLRSGFPVVVADGTGSGAEVADALLDEIERT